MVYCLIFSLLLVVNAQPQCDPLQTEIFYQNAENFTTGWTYNPAGLGFNNYYYFEDAYYMVEIDDDSTITTPNFLSNLGAISTVGYTDISINYGMKQFAVKWSVNETFQGLTTADGECGTSYTVDGTTFTPIDTQVAVAGISIDSIQGWYAATPLTYVTEQLGTDTNDINTLQIRWDKTSLWPTDSGSLFQYCVIAEIRLCGTSTAVIITSTTSAATGTVSSVIVDGDESSASSESSDSSDSSESVFFSMNNVDEMDEQHMHLTDNDLNDYNVVISVSFVNLCVLFGLMLLCSTWLFIYQHSKKGTFIKPTM